jgi:hypothetical protein
MRHQFSAKIVQEQAQGVGYVDYQSEYVEPFFRGDPPPDPVQV